LRVGDGCRGRPRLFRLKGRITVKRVVLAAGLSLAAAQPALALDPDVNLSGTFGFSLSWFKNNSVGNEFTDLDTENNGSNFRLTAAANEIGIRAFMAYERGASNDQTNVEDVREFFGGISGKMGTVLYGRKATDYRLAGERVDPFYNTSVAFGYNAVGNGGFASEGASYGLSNLTNGYTSNTISLRTPVWGGFTLNGAGYINENRSNVGVGDDPDFAFGAGYTNSDWLGLDVGLQFLDLNGNVVTNAPGQATALRAHASVGEKLWAAGVSIEAIDVQAEADARQYAFASASYQVLEDLRLALAYGNVTNSPGFDGNGVTVGAFYDLTKNLGLYTALRHVALTNGTENKATTLAGGVKFVFDVDL
jgi:predicted porin